MLLAILTLFLIIFLCIWKWPKAAVPKGLKSLPGPKGLPFIGSVHELPEKLAWMKFASWGKEYGPIYQVNLAGCNHVWISTDAIARELLSKRKNIYSDRPHIPALQTSNQYGHEYLPLMSRSGDYWARQKKFGTHIMRTTEAANFNSYPELESIRLCHELINDPSRYNHHLESFVSRVTCRLAWGRAEAFEELKQRARELLISVSPTGAFGNKLPFIMWLPEWLSSPKAWERKRHNTEKRWFTIMQEQVRNDMSEKVAPLSWMRLFIEESDKFGFTGQQEGAYAIGMHGIAGALTIAAPMQSFCLAISHYPEFLPMLQQELDKVCPNRLPSYADRENLPVLRAFIKETIRWRPPVPTGIPHKLTEDDEFEGYHIPKGSVVHPLEWSICREPKMFPNPDDFNPLRWLDPDYPTYKEPLSQFPTIRNMSQFGYGHRTCLGQAVSEADLIVAIGALAWLFDIKRSPNTAQSSAVHPQGQSQSEAFVDEKKKNKKNWYSDDEELTTGLNNTSHSDYDDSSEDDERPAGTGTFAVDTIEKLRWHAIQKIKKQWKKQQQKEQIQAAETFNFSTLLIAKPLPFKFELTVRNHERAAMIERMYQEKRTNGDFKESTEYWGDNNGKGKEFGWVKTWT